MPKLDSDLKHYVTIEEEGTKVKIKNILYSAAGLHINIRYLTPDK